MSMSDKHYDLIIIGTGSGNSIPGPEFDDKTIAIVEKGVFGGTCLNVGCIPTKMFVHAAEIAHTITHAKDFGINAKIDHIDWSRIVSDVFDKRIDPIAQGGEAYRRGPETPNIDVYDHHAYFVGEKTIHTGQGNKEMTISADTIVLAAGARPFIPPVIAESGITYYTNEDIMRIAQLPRSLIVLGGGFIAAEFAHIFHALGVEVTLVNRSTTLLRSMDKDISERFTKLSEETFHTKLGHTIVSAHQQAQEITLKLDDGSIVRGDMLLVATGRIPNGDQMSVDKAGIELLDDGRVKVDEYGRTTAEGIWALGDICSPYQLKHVANAEMRTVKHNILHPENLHSLPHKHVPSAVFTQPQIATVGLTEQQARDKGHNISVKIQNYSDIAYGWALHDDTGFAKLIADKDTGTLLGAHIIGPQAATLIQQLITVLAFQLPLQQVATQEYWIHPALPELIENALLGLDLE
ncbi:mycothione reductase [Corynebacterium sp. sy017]|uniref:mycothione reductase n=1 Tax=unclassified Corynebacterium TaxID=2624378 RepID=UPI0011872AD3|nr:MULTISPECIES: mycothione reductase [unclassified Corynebacterium]MBP3087843.1 mycothione reductase [Corynebacterium sp. sy017]TSD92386.1 mycothione reductase [Corynebacterium sp. SY003]